MSAVMRSQMAYPVGRITIVPRTGPLSVSSALAITSWYQRGKSSACGVSTLAMPQEGTGWPSHRTTHPAIARWLLPKGVARTTLAASARRYRDVQGRTGTARRSTYARRVSEHAYELV